MMKECLIFLSALIGLFILIGATLFSYFDSPETIDEWFVVSAFSVPDHKAGEDPVIVFEREIKRPLAGQWSVETQIRKSNGRFTTVCRGSGLSHYSPDENLPPGGVTLSWFRGLCHAGEGQYRLQVVWQFTDAVTGEARTRIVESGVFEVY